MPDVALPQRKCYRSASLPHIEMLLVRMNVNVVSSPTGRPHEAKDDAYNKSGANKRHPEPLQGKLR
jgi:hypothetical protein